MSFNKTIVVGNLGRDPELRYTPQGTAVCNFSIATNEKRKGKDGESQDITTWFKVTLWNKQAENASKYLTKGSPVYIEGRLRVEEWADKEGKNRYTLEIHATDMQFLGGKGDNAGGGFSGAPEDSHAMSSAAGATSSGNTSGNNGNTEPAMPPPADDDIPF